MVAGTEAHESDRCQKDIEACADADEYHIDNHEDKADRHTGHSLNAALYKRDREKGCEHTDARCCAQETRFRNGKAIVSDDVILHDAHDRTLNGTDHVEDEKGNVDNFCSVLHSFTFKNY